MFPKDLLPWFNRGFFGIFVYANPHIKCDNLVDLNEHVFILNTIIIPLFQLDKMSINGIDVLSYLCIIINCIKYS